MHRYHYLVFYYDGKENKAAVVHASDKTAVPGYIENSAFYDNLKVLMVLELHHDYFDADPIDWSPSLVIDGIQFNVNALPHFGIP